MRASLALMDALAEDSVLMESVIVKKDLEEAAALIGLAANIRFL